MPRTQRELKTKTVNCELTGLYSVVSEWPKVTYICISIYHPYILRYIRVQFIYKVDESMPLDLESLLVWWILVSERLYLNSHTSTS